MTKWLGWISRMAVVAAAAATQSVAQAQDAAPAITGNGWIAIAIIVALVAIVVAMISGVINISSRDAPDDDGAGFGVIEGIDEDEDRQDKKKR